MNGLQLYVSVLSLKDEEFLIVVLPVFNPQLDDWICFRW